MTNFPDTSPEYPELGWIHGHDEQGRRVLGWSTSFKGTRLGELQVVSEGTSAASFRSASRKDAKHYVDLLQSLAES